MNLEQALKILESQVADFREPVQISESEWQNYCQNTVVALMAGGESSRYAAVLESQNVNKNAHELPNGDTMIEMAIRMYAEAGLKNFVALVYHNAHSVEQRLGDGSKLEVSIKYSYDPEQQVGKGGAIKNALINGSIPAGVNLIVANPDDVVLDFPGSFPKHIASAHLEGQAKGMLATAVLAPGQALSSTGMAVSGGRVTDASMYPFIPIPAHIGVTLFSPNILPRFNELFDLSQKSDFEQVLFPVLVAEQKLWSVALNKGAWIAVNDLKSYNQLVSRLNSQ